MERLLLIILSSLFTTNAIAQYSISITPVDSNIYLYTSYGDVGNYKNIDANAAFVVSGGNVVIFDTPWDNTQAQQLISYIQDSLHKNILLSIITHAHVDRIGSIETFHKTTFLLFVISKQLSKHLSMAILCLKRYFILRILVSCVVR